MQIPYSAILGRQEVPSLGSVLNGQDYEGPRTTSATNAVAKHIRSFYRLFATIGIILIMIAFGIITIILGHVKRNACPGSERIPIIFIVFGIIDVILCAIIMIIAILRVTYCYYRSGLVCLLIFIGLGLLSMTFLTVVFPITSGAWMTIMLESLFNKADEDTNCEKSVRYFMFLITICVLLSFFSPLLYLYIAGCKVQRERTVDSRVHFTILE